MSGKYLKYSCFGIYAVITLFGLISPARAAFSSAATAPTLGIAQLINQLGNDNPHDRERAQSQLEDLGSQATESLSIAIRTDGDPEIRSRAAAALAAIKERETFLASPVTVHANNQPLKEVLATIGSCAHCELIDGGSLMAKYGDRGRTVTLDMVNQPFWETIISLCGQLNYCPFMGSAGTKAMRLFPASRNWLTQSPHDVVGPYLVTAVGISRTRSIDLLGAPLTSDQLGMRFNLFPEPKMSVLDMSDFIVTEAKDEAGNSLVQPLNGRPQSRLALHDSRNVNFMADAKLYYPARAGTKISSLSGNITVVVGDNIQQCEVDDVTSVPAVPHPLGLGNAEATVTQNIGTFGYQAVIKFKKADLNDDQWFVIEKNTVELTLEDAKGVALPGRVENAKIQAAVNPADASGTITAQFFTGNSAHPGGIHTGKPTRLKLRIPKSIRTIVIPITIKDIPIP